MGGHCPLFLPVTDRLPVVGFRLGLAAVGGSADPALFPDLAGPVDRVVYGGSPAAPPSGTGSRPLPAEMEGNPALSALLAVGVQPAAGGAEVGGQDLCGRCSRTVRFASALSDPAGSRLSIRPVPGKAAGSMPPISPGLFPVLSAHGISDI